MKRSRLLVTVLVAAACRGNAVPGDASPTDSGRDRSAVSVFEARGSEPGWFLRVAGDTVTYIGNYGADTTVAPYVRTTNTDGSTTYSSAPSRLTVTVRAETCGDAATGMPHPFTVSVTKDSTTVNGCGGQPQSLLTGSEWLVSDIAGTATAPSPPTMTFSDSGRVAGGTPCNRFSAPFTLTGERLTFGPAIATKRYCEPAALMEREALLLSVLAAVSRFELGRDRTLRLVTDDGRAIVARRQ